MHDHITISKYYVRNERQSHINAALIIRITNYMKIYINVKKDVGFTNLVLEKFVLKI
jgi:hypothetical protein